MWPSPSKRRAACHGVTTARQAPPPDAAGLLTIQALPDAALVCIFGLVGPSQHRWAHGLLWFVLQQTGAPALRMTVH